MQRPTTTHPLTILVLLGAALAGGATCHRGSPAPPAYQTPESLGDGWETAHAETVGLDPDLLHAATRAVHDGQYRDVDSMLVARHGRLVHEVYFGRYDRTTVHDLRSATKSITSMLIGIAIDDGLLAGVDARVLRLLPGYSDYQNRDPRKEEIRIKHLLTMTPGLDCNDWDAGSPGNEEKMYGKNDWVQFILDLPMRAEPGTRWGYCTGGVVTLGAVLGSVTGRSPDAFARESLFAPLGISDYHWEYTPIGQVDTGGHIHLRPRDMAKLGQLMLNRGTWNGARILSDHWADDSTAAHTRLPSGQEYGYLWWRSRTRAGVDFYYADGNGGQHIIVAPDLDLVVVFTGRHYNSNTPVGLTMFDKFVVGAIR